MAFAQRYLIALFIILTVPAAIVMVRAQQPTEHPVTFRAISIGYAATPLLYETAPGKALIVAAGNGELSQAYMSPPDGMVSFYREVPAEKSTDKPRRIPAGKAHLGDEGGPYIIILSPSPNNSDPTKTELQVIDDSWTAHPIQTVRVLNFSKRLAAVQVASASEQINTGGTHIFPYPSGKGYILFKVALMEESGWVLRWNAPEGIIPNARPTFVITDMFPDPEDPRPLAIDITSIFDTSPQPTPAPDRLAVKMIH